MKPILILGALLGAAYCLKSAYTLGRIAGLREALAAIEQQPGLLDPAFVEGQRAASEWQ